MKSNSFTIVVAADHAGFVLKESIKSFLQGKGYSVLDVGAHELVDGDDYPTYMAAAALKVAEDIEGNTKAVIFGGSGQGEAIVANRFPGVRAVVWYGNPISGASHNSGRGEKLDSSSESSQSIIKLSREHNDANILSIGARFVREEEAKKAITQWLETPFSQGESHERRINQIDSIE